MVCITETECVYCAVRTEYLSNFRLSFNVHGSVRRDNILVYNSKVLSSR